MKNFSKRSLMQIVAAGAALSIGASTFAATGMSISRSQSELISKGMTSTQVREKLGRPAHQLKQMKSAGRTWIYDINQVNIPSTHVVFYVEFGGDGKVIATSERMETEETEF